MLGKKVSLSKYGTIIFLFVVLTPNFHEAVGKGPNIFGNEDLTHPCMATLDPLQDTPDGAKESSQLFLVKYHVNLMAKLHKNLFMEYVNQSFNAREIEELNTVWSNEHLSWLPGSEAIPKQIGEKLSQSYLHSIDLASSLSALDNYLQAYTIGLQDMILTTPNTLPERVFKWKSMILYGQLKVLRCSILDLLTKFGEKPDLDLIPEIIRDKFLAPTLQSKTIPSRKVMNYLIFRDYVNFVEYMVDLLDFIQKNYYVNTN